MMKEDLKQYSFYDAFKYLTMLLKLLFGVFKLKICMLCFNV